MTGVLCLFPLQKDIIRAQALLVSGEPGKEWRRLEEVMKGSFGPGKKKTLALLSVLTMRVEIFSYTGILRGFHRKQAWT